MTVENGDIVVSAFLRRFQVKFGEVQFDSVAWSGCVMPGTVLLVRVVFGIVGTDHLGSWVRDLKGAASFLAVVSVLVQHKAVVALAHIRADRVSTDMLTSAVIEGTFIFVCEQLMSACIITSCHK